MNKKNKQNEKAEQVQSEVVKPQQKTGTLAVISLALGIASIVCCFPLLGSALAIAAVILGIIELNNIKNGKSSPQGRVMAIIGLVLGGLAIAWSIVSFFIMGIGSFFALLDSLGNW